MNMFQSSDPKDTEKIRRSMCSTIHFITQYAHIDKNFKRHTIPQWAHMSQSLLYFMKCKFHLCYIGNMAMAEIEKSRMLPKSDTLCDYKSTLYSRHIPIKMLPQGTKRKASWNCSVPYTVITTILLPYPIQHSRPGHCKAHVFPPRVIVPSKWPSTLLLLGLPEHL
jgi:hypothetical protein